MTAPDYRRFHGRSDRVDAIDGRGRGPRPDRRDRKAARGRREGHGCALWSGGLSTRAEENDGRSHDPKGFTRTGEGGRGQAAQGGHASCLGARRLPQVALETVWGLGPVLVEACGISTGQQVLDVAAGTGNTAIRAAETGAEVVASDLTPENFEAGRREAKAHGVELEWVEADAEELLFGDSEFDVVTSSFGAMFAPNHQAVADELVRVCRPGGTIGMLNFTPEGLAAGFFGALAPYAPPPPPGAASPLMWGSEVHVRELFGERVKSLKMTRKEIS